MLNDIKQDYIDILLDNPLQIAHWLGYSKLTNLNNDWMKSFICEINDQTKLAHRGSYKTTCVSISIAIIMILMPNQSILFMRKTDDDVKEIIEQVRKILLSDVFYHIAIKIYGKPLILLKTNANEITTNLVTRPSGSVQLMGLGIKASLTGKHFDIIFTDDIVNLKDRISRAEREYTKQIYQELQNIKNRGGRFVNTGTPWHKDDCISLMPNKEEYNCYSTGLMTRNEIEAQREKLTPSVFAANYELKHIASEKALFTISPQFKSGDNLLYDGLAHIDAAYGGEDGSALTLLKKSGNIIYVLGKIRKTHIDNCLDEYLLIKKRYRCGVIEVEDNADKGYLKKEIVSRGDFAHGYHESTNKYIKISTYLKKYWKQLVFLEDTDPEYISEIMDYTEDAEHDDCPDSLSSILRKVDKGNVFQYA